MEVIDRALPPSTDLPENMPTRIGDFRIVREIGRGGMGVVYEAEQTSLNRKVALKVLSVTITGTPQSVKRFQREAQAAGRLHHTNIVPIHAMGQHAGYWYYAMELIEGLSLSRVIDQQRVGSGHATEESLARRAGSAAPSTGGLDTGTGTGTRAYFVRLAEVFAGVADALHLVHDEGIVHRDIKPSNLLLDADGVLKIVDFGLALQVDAGGPSMTLTGDLLGTPVYMSPEQAMAKRIKVDHRTDIYSLGATLYELLTLRPPFEGKSLHDLCSQIVTKDPVLPRRRNRRVPRDLETIVLKAMDKDRAKRYQTGAGLAQDLRRFAEGGAIRARRIGLTGRAWRKMKRHKVRTMLVAAMLLFAIGGGVVAIRAHREARTRREIQYAQLMARAGEEFTRAFAVDPFDDVASHVALQEPSMDLLARAIEVLPDRPEAYFDRVFMSGRTTDERMVDLERARSRGLPKKTYHLARGCLARQYGVVSAGAARNRATQDGPNTVADDYFEGLLLLRQGSLQDAEILLTRVIESKEPGRIRLFMAHRHREWLRGKRGDAAGSLEDLHAMQTLGGGGFRVDARIAAVWQLLGQKEASERCFEGLLAEVRQEKDPTAWRVLVNSLRSSNPECQAHELLDRAAREAVEAYPESPRLLREVATALQEMRRFDEAVEALQRAVSCDPQMIEAWRQLSGLLCDRLRRFDEALQASGRALEIDPSNPRALRNHASILWHLKQYEEAVKTLARIKSDYAEYEYAQWLRGRCLLRLGRTSEALEVYEQTLDWQRDNLRALVGKASCLDRLKRYEEAEAVNRRITELDPDNYKAYWNCGVLLRRLGRDRKALKAFDRFVEIKPADPRAHQQRGELLGKLDKRVEALSVYEQALECFDPKEVPPGPLNNMALILATCREKQLRDPVRAVKLASRAVELGSWAGFRNTLGVALYSAGRWREALEALQESMGLRRGGDSYDWFFVAMAKHKLGQDDARKWFDKAVVWMEKNKRDDQELKRFRAEAEEVLGIKKD